jgi:hypothetical protein
MRFIISLGAVIVALSVAAFPVFAQGRGNGQAKKQPTQTTRTKAETPKTKGTRTTTTTKTETRTVKADARAARANAKAESRAAKADATAGRTATVSTTQTTTQTTPIANVTPTTPTTRPVKNPKLEARLLKMLPPDTTIQDAMAGFKNWGQFVAAVHVSNNLAIPFADLKAKMTGITPTPDTTVQGTSMSLGQAIQSLKGGTTTADGGTTLTTTRIRNEVKKAEDAATTDLRQTRESS